MSNDASNSESTSDRPVAKVYPSKKSYKSIAADVDVSSAFAELIDNSRDSAAIHDIDPVDVEIYYDNESDDLVYSDTAGGVAGDEMGVFLGLGQSKDVRAQGRNIGAFGMGTKKALNHLADSFTIASRHIDAEQGWKYHVGEDFFDEENEEWEFEMEPADLEPGQTELRLHELTFDWNEEKDGIRENLSQTYQRFLGESHETPKRLDIRIDSEPLSPPADATWTFSPWQGGLHPRKFTGLEFTNDKWSAPIEVEITVGLLRSSDISNIESGTAFYCQDRLVEEGLTGEKGGFGVAGLNKFNSAQDKRLRIEIDFYTKGDADDLPWNSDKSRISRMHEALSGEQGVYYWLRRMADRHKKVGKYGEAPPWIFTPYDADDPHAANSGEIEQVNIGSKQQRLKQGEVGQVRIHQKPDKDLADVHAMERVVEAHAALGIRSERVDWFESWMLPAYREGVFSVFTDRYDTDDESLVELLDIDTLSEVVKDGKFDKEEVLAALHEVDEAPDGRAPPWEDNDTINTKVDQIDETAASDAEKERRQKATELAPWKRHRYQYTLHATAEDIGTDVGEFEVIETNEQQEPAMEPSSEEQTSSVETEEGQQQVIAGTQPASESEPETDEGAPFEPAESESETLEIDTETISSEVSDTTTESQETPEDTSTSDATSTASSPQSATSTEPSTTTSVTDQEDHVARQLRELRDEYDELFEDLDIDPEEDPEEWLPDLMQAAEQLKRFESMLNDAPVEGDSFEDRLNELLQKAKKYDQMMSVADE